MEFDVNKKYDAKTFSRALRQWAEDELSYGELICDIYGNEECMEYYEYYADTYKNMAEWFEDVPEEFSDCLFELIECGSENFGHPIVEATCSGKTLYIEFDSNGYVTRIWE